MNTELRSDEAVQTDQELAEAAAAALDGDSMLRNEDIVVTVSRGWATLKGEVEWNYQKADAERVIRRVWGIKDVTNSITVKTKPTPAELKEQIERALVRNALTDAHRISVELEGNKVVLRGMVRSWAEREEAERVAWAASGVTQVDNQIVISY